MTPLWRAFTPQYTRPRGAQTARLGAHAFYEEAPRSLCGYVPRDRAGGPATTTARRCVLCARLITRNSMDRSAA